MLRIQEGVRAHELVGAHQVGLAGLAQAGAGPHHGVQVVQGELHGQHADALAVVDDGRGHEGRRRLVGREVGAEVREDHGVGVLGRGGAAVHVAQAAVGVGAVLQGGGVVQLLERGVHDAPALLLHQEDVVVAEGLQVVAQGGVVERVVLVVAARLGGAVQQVLGAQGTRVGLDVAPLHGHGHVVQLGQHALHVRGLAAVLLAVGAAELLTVVPGQLRAQVLHVAPDGRRHVLGVLREGRHGLHRGELLGERHGLVADGLQVALHLLLLDVPQADELGEGLVLQRRAGLPQGDQGEDREGEDAGGQEGREQLGLEREASQRRSFRACGARAGRCPGPR